MFVTCARPRIACRQRLCVYQELRCQHKPNVGNVARVIWDIDEDGVRVLSPFVAFVVLVTSSLPLYVVSCGRLTCVCTARVAAPLALLPTVQFVCNPDQLLFRIESVDLLRPAKLHVRAVGWNVKRGFAPQLLPLLPSLPA